MSLLAVLAIIGGDPVQSYDPVARSTVAIGHLERRENGERVLAHCSGSLIDRDLVVTAAHCVKGGRDLRVIFERDATEAAVRARIVSGYETHPSYREHYDAPDLGTRDNNDIALVRFEGALPDDYRAATLLPSDFRLFAGAPVTIAGYGKPGRDEDGGGEIGVLRRTEVTISDPDYGRTEVQLDERAGHENSGGDSGGPAFLRDGDDYYLFGVCNWGRQGRFAVFADVRSHLDWLKVAARHLRHPSERVDFAELRL